MKAMSEIELKLVLYLCLINQTFLSILSDYQREIRLQKKIGMKVEAQIEDDENVIALSKCSKKYTLKYINSFSKISNYKKVKSKLDVCMGEISKSAKNKKFNPVLLLVGGLRHFPFEKVEGFNDLKAIDLTSIIAKARIEKYLNKWDIQKHSITIKEMYWEA